MQVKNIDQDNRVIDSLNKINNGGINIAKNGGIACCILQISTRNESAVSYDLSAPRFAVESKRRTKRGLQYEKAVFPKQSWGLGTIQPGGVGKLVFTFDKIALTRGQVLRLYFYEKGGSRNFVLPLGMGDINNAKRLN